MVFYHNYSQVISMAKCKTAVTPLHMELLQSCNKPSMFCILAWKRLVANTEDQVQSWCQLLSPQVVITTCGASSDDRVGILWHLSVVGKTAPQLINRMVIIYIWNLYSGMIICFENISICYDAMVGLISSASEYVNYPLNLYKTIWFSRCVSN